MTPIRFGAPLLLALVSPSVLAQAPATPSAPAPALGGTAIPGLCFLSREAIFANSKIGLAASARLRQISDAAQAEVDSARKPIDAELQTFRTEAAKLTPAQREPREKALNDKLQALQATAQLRSREIEATRAKAMDRIATEAQPIIAQVYASRSCGLLVDRNIIFGGNLANDLTAGVVQALDAKITTISFDRATVPAAQ